MSALQRSSRLKHFVIPLLVGTVTIASAPAQSERSTSPFCSLLLQRTGPTVPPTEVSHYFAARFIRHRKQSVVYSDVPGVDRLSISTVVPKIRSSASAAVSAGVEDPFLERARVLNLYEDYKPLSDLKLKDLPPQEIEKLRHRAALDAEKANGDFEGNFLKRFISLAYEKPVEELVSAAKYLPKKWKMNSGSASIDAAFDYTERTWSKLAYETAPKSGGSLLPSPYPVLVPAGRFQEAYYWDSYFGMKGLFATDRLDVVQMQVENFLEYVRRYGFVPNGGRDYYLTRSQPPFLSSMVREVYEVTLKQDPAAAPRLREWLKVRAYELVKRDYEKFWMNPKTRYDAFTGLNHHWDDLDIPRPERHGADDELKLGKTYRDVRAGAESGLDFTDAFQNEPTKVAGVLLNAMLYKTEIDLAWMSKTLGDETAAAKFSAAAGRRQQAIDRHLWNSNRNRYEPYHLRKGANVNAATADAYSALFVGLASTEQAKAMRDGLKTLEREGGLMASNLTSSIHQWDGPNGWAPLQVMAIEGLRRYGYEADAKRIAQKWVNALAKIHHDTGAMYERIDVNKITMPQVDPHKYPTQEGFLWTNGSFVWAATEVLKLPIQPTAP